MIWELLLAYLIFQISGIFSGLASIFNLYSFNSSGSYPIPPLTWCKRSRPCSVRRKGKMTASWPFRNLQRHLKTQYFLLFSSEYVIIKNDFFFKIVYGQKEKVRFCKLEVIARMSLQVKDEIRQICILGETWECLYRVEGCAFRQQNQHMSEQKDTPWKLVNDLIKLINFTNSHSLSGC